MSKFKQLYVDHIMSNLFANRLQRANKKFQDAAETNGDTHLIGGLLSYRNNVQIYSLDKHLNSISIPETDIPEKYHKYLDVIVNINNQQRKVCSALRWLANSVDKDIEFFELLRHIFPLFTVVSSPHLDIQITPAIQEKLDIILVAVAMRGM